MSTSVAQQAGRELDALIAASVFGRPHRKPTHGTCCTCQTCGWDKDNCECGYSDDITKAWEVVEKLNARGEWVTVGLNAAHRAQCFISTSGERENVDVEAETAPLAICLAALRAVGAEPPEGAPQP